jgi:hypothetical protein
VSRSPSEQPGEPFPGQPTGIIRRVPTGPIPQPADDRTTIIRRTPTGPVPAPADDNRTTIIRHTPTGPVPAPADDNRTTIIRRAPTGPVPVTPFEPATTGIAQPPGVPPAFAQEGPRSCSTAVAACVLAILGGWATSVVATQLITGWWDTDRLFCVAVGFLALIFAASTISGVILLLLRRHVGRHLTVAGAVVALLACGGVFIAGAIIPGIVYAIPLLPVASGVLAMLPSTRRWCHQPDRVRY